MKSIKASVPFWATRLSTFIGRPKEGIITSTDNSENISSAKIYPGSPLKVKVAASIIHEEDFKEDHMDDTNKNSEHREKHHHRPKNKLKPHLINKPLKKTTLNMNICDYLRDNNFEKLTTFKIKKKL